jgi:hypothetical protein
MTIETKNMGTLPQPAKAKCGLNIYGLKITLERIKKRKGNILNGKRLNEKYFVKGKCQYTQIDIWLHEIDMFMYFQNETPNGQKRRNDFIDKTHETLTSWGW